MATEQSSRYLHVAAIQMLPATDEPEANIQRATRLVREAVFKHGAEVVVLPECTLTGYSQPSNKGPSLAETLIVFPQATSCTCRLPIHRDQLRVRAYENEVFLAMANWAGPTFQGHSMIIGFDGETIEIGDEDEQILFAALEMSALRKHRDRGIYGRHHRQPGAYGPLLQT